MQKKHIRELLAAAALAAATAMTSCAAFARTATYNGEFTDVASDAWYAGNVADSFELGFMKGDSATTFSPNGKVTVAEGITMAVRMNAINSGKTDPGAAASGNWYDTYVKYAVDNGLIKADTFDNYERNITRAEMATLFHDAMPAGYYTAINAVKEVPDVNITAPYADKIVALYNAGIVMGSDAYGTFNPDNDIIRCEAAAIINRVALPERRLKKTLEKSPARDAFQLIYNTSFANSLTARDSSTIDNLPGGWTIDNRGGTPRTSIEEAFSSVVDRSETEPTALIRTFNKITDEVLSADISFSTGSEGASVEFRDVDGKTAYILKLTGGKLCALLADGSYKALYTPEAEGVQQYKVRLTVDIPAKTVSAVINGTVCEATPLLSDNLIDLRFGVDEKGTGSIAPGKISVGANYSVYEWYDLFGLEAYNGWNVTGETAITNAELTMKGAVKASKTFKPITTKYGFSTMFILPNHEDLSFTVSAGGYDAVKVASVGGKLIANGTELYDLTKNMWYRLRIEANPSAETADIRINGRVIGTVPLLYSGPVDTLTIESASGEAKIDYTELFAIADHPDYCPIPENKASLDDYTVLLNVCNLWRNNGDHYAWSCITPYDENRPVIGYYDEGNPESADWEIKMMVEHGIDVQAVCWYNDNANGPLKYQHLSDQLNSGFQLAKYSDYMKYVLILELNAQGFNFDQYRNNVLPFLFENYFLDDRYLKIDNKIVIHTFGTSQLSTSKYFGSDAGVEEALAYTEEVAKSYGYDGVLLFGNAGASWVDGHAAYGWGNLGYSYDYNVTQNELGLAAAKKGGYYMIPTVSVGFNILGWGHTRSPMMDVDTYRKTNLWVRDTYMPANANPDDWTRNITLMSTWNEYGEGTYIMPSGLNGFGYLDVLREVYTDLPADHEDEIPTDAQLERITHMYPQHQAALYPLHTGEDVTKSNTEVSAEAELVTYLKSDLSEDNSKLEDNSHIKLGEGYTYDENGLTCSAADADPRITVSDAVGLESEKISYIKVTMKAPKGSKVELFYTNDAGAALSQANSFNTVVESDEMAEVMFKTEGRANWKGCITSLRLDPVSTPNTEFSVKAVEFITAKYPEPDPVPELYANTMKIESYVPAETKDGKILFPYDQTTAIQHILFTHMIWDKANGKLTVEGNRHSVTYTVGSDKYIVDGKEKALGYTMYLSDGLPMIDMEGFAAALGFTYKKDGVKVYIETPDVGLYKEISERVDGIYEFNGYDTEGFGSSHFSLYTADGYLHAETIATTEDVIMTRPNVSISTAEYMGIEFRVRFAYDNAKHTEQMLSMYYITDRDTTWNEAKTVKAKLGGFDSNGEWMTFTVDMRENPNWQNTITSLRFDPFNGYGYMDIDYIRFIENPDYDPQAELLAQYQIINGDAEASPIAFNSGNAKITIVEDETNPGNHVWNVECSSSSRSWTYFIQGYKLEKGKSYYIAYDLRALPDTMGEMHELSISCNMQYLDKTNSIENATRRDHNAIQTKVPADGSWVHAETLYEIATMDSPADTNFSLYCNPTGDADSTASGCYQVDNVVVLPAELVDEEILARFQKSDKE